MGFRGRSLCTASYDTKGWCLITYQGVLINSQTYQPAPWAAAAIMQTGMEKEMSHPPPDKTHSICNKESGCKVHYTGHKPEVATECLKYS